MRIILFEDNIDHYRILRKIAETTFPGVTIFPKEEPINGNEDNEFQLMRKSFSRIYSDKQGLENSARKFYRDIVKIEPSDYIILDYKLASNGKNGLDIYEKLNLTSKTIIFTTESDAKFDFIQNRIQNNSIFKNTIVAIEKGDIDNLPIILEDLYIRTLRANFTENGTLKQTNTTTKPLKVFIAYSKYDGEAATTNTNSNDKINYLQNIKRHLVTLTKINKTLEIWDDTYLLPAENWDEKIKAKIEESDIHFILVSTNLLNVEYFLDIELPKIIEKYNKKESLLFPIFIKSSDWKDLDKLKNLEGFPRKGSTLDNPSEWNSESAMYTELLEAIKKVIKNYKSEEQ